MRFIIAALLIVTGLAVSAQPPSKQSSQERIETNIAPILQITGHPVPTFSIEERLKQLGIPGVSIAVAHKGKIIWQAGYGMADVSQNRKMDTNTLLLAGSISKPVAALRALQLVEDGKIDLDGNINDYLTSWQVPENEFTKTEKVTLRRILNHTAGLTVWGFPGYDKGDDIPSAVDVLNGKGNTDEVVVYKTPGESWQYSGGGYTIMQIAVADVTKQAFAASMQQQVLNPLSMQNSTYQNPLPQKYHSIAATGYRENGDEVEGKWPIYPEMAAAGLWTTPSQLVQYGIEIQRIHSSKKDGILSAKMVGAMLTPGENNHGLGPNVNEHTFGHGGADEGFRARLITWKDSSYAVVVMVNSDNGAIVREILLAIANEYELPDIEPIVRTLVKPEKAVLARYVGTYSTPDDGEVQITLVDEGLSIYYEEYEYRFTARPQSDTEFFHNRNGSIATFSLNDEKQPVMTWRNIDATKLD